MLYKIFSVALVAVSTDAVTIRSAGESQFFGGLMDMAKSAVGNPMDAAKSLVGDQAAGALNAVTQNAGALAGAVGGGDPT